MGKAIISGGAVMTVPVGPPTLSTLAVGSIVKLNENGIPVEFYVAKHDYGYGVGTDERRTLLVKKGSCGRMAWHSSLLNVYRGSSVDVWLTETYRAMLDAEIQSALAGISIKSSLGKGNSGTETLSREIFLLAMDELGLTKPNALNSALGYGTLPIAELLVTNSITGGYGTWTRTAAKGDTVSSHAISFDSYSGAVACGTTSTINVRPCFTLPATAKVQADGTIKL